MVWVSRSVKATLSALKSSAWIQCLNSATRDLATRHISGGWHFPGGASWLVTWPTMGWGEKHGGIKQRSCQACTTVCSNTTSRFFQRQQSENDCDSQQTSPEWKQHVSLRCSDEAQNVHTHEAQCRYCRILFAYFYTGKVIICVKTKKNVLCFFSAVSKHLSQLLITSFFGPLVPLLDVGLDDTSLCVKHGTFWRPGDKNKNNFGLGSRRVIVSTHVFPQQCFLSAWLFLSSGGWFERG